MNIVRVGRTYVNLDHVTCAGDEDGNLKLLMSTPQAGCIGGTELEFSGTEAELMRTTLDWWCDSSQPVGLHERLQRKGFE